jgi:CubicO group peptidase (beta-lactamase class C family)
VGPTSSACGSAARRLTASPSLLALAALALLQANCCEARAAATAASPTRDAPAPAIPANGRAEAGAEAALGADLDALLAQERMTGVVWSTVDGDRVHAGARGTADALRNTPLTADARMSVGSIAKTLVALAVLRRVTQGLLDLDAPVQDLLPGMPVDNAWAATHPLRLRHLIDMTGGLDDLRLWQVFSARTEPDVPLLEVLRRDPSVLRLRTPPGARFSYSNVSFTLAAAVLERNVGERYETWIEREVLRPLGMVDSTLLYRVPVRDGGYGDARLAWGHVEGRTPVVAPAWALRPAAQFATTAPDMARLATFLLGDGRLGGEPFIDTELFAALGRPEGTEAARAGLPRGYGLGLYSRDRHGAVGLCHGGNTAGFHALFCVYRDTRRAFFVAHNTDREGAAYERFVARLAAELGVETPAEPPMAGPVPAGDRAWSGRYVPAPSRNSQAALADRLLGHWTLRIGGAGAALQPASGPSRTLVRTGPRLYRQDDRRRASLVLLTDADGRPLIASGTLTLRRMGGFEHAALWTATAGGLAGLAWWLLAPAWRRARRGVPLSRTPAWWAMLALVGAGIALALQPWQQLGDPTPASTALAASTLVLPFALAWQGALAWRHRPAGRATPRVWLDLVALLLGLTLVGLLAAFGLWPLVLWRL